MWRCARSNTILRADPVYQQAADARSSGCIGVGGDAQVRARAGAPALASALAAMRENACVDACAVADGDADADEPPLTWPSQPDRNGRRRRQRRNGGDQRVGSRNLGGWRCGVHEQMLTRW